MADYVNNKELFAELCIFNAAYILATEAGLERPQISNKIAHAIMQVCTRMANSYNFCNYTYKDEMISDAILKCYKKIHGFDPLRSENPFAYVSQIAWNSFLYRIKEEQKESSIKARMIREKMSDEFVQHGVDTDADEGSNAFVEFLKENDAFVDYIELRKENAKTIHPSLKHRNKTPYVKKFVELKEDDTEFDLSDFEAV